MMKKEAGYEGRKKGWSEGRERVSKRIVEENMMINEEFFLLKANILSSY
jgi:hypothetical protein